MSNKLGVGIIVSVFLISCGLSEAKPEAEELWKQYFGAVQSESYQNVIPLYSDEFYKKTPKEDWIKILKKIRDNLGTPENFKQVNWKVQAQAHTSKSGTVVTLIYDVQYSKHEAREAIQVFKPASGEEALIMAHNINSNAFLSP